MVPLSVSIENRSLYKAEVGVKRDLVEMGGVGTICLGVLLWRAFPKLRHWPEHLPIKGMGWVQNRQRVRL